MFLTYCNRCIPIGLHDGNDQNFQTFFPIDNFHRQQLQWQRLFSTFYPFHSFSSPHNCFLHNCFHHNYFHLKYMKEFTFFFQIDFAKVWNKTSLKFHFEKTSFIKYWRTVVDTHHNYFFHNYSVLGTPNSSFYYYY